MIFLKPVMFFVGAVLAVYINYDTSNVVRDYYAHKMQFDTIELFVITQGERKCFGRQNTYANTI